MKMNWVIILGIVVSLVVFNTAAQIELWNHLAKGGVLPNHEGGKIRSDGGGTE